MLVSTRRMVLRTLDCKKTLMPLPGRAHSSIAWTITDLLGWRSFARMSLFQISNCEENYQRIIVPLTSLVHLIAPCVFCLTLRTSFQVLRVAHFQSCRLLNHSTRSSLFIVRNQYPFIFLQLTARVDQLFLFYFLFGIWKLVLLHDNGDSNEIQS